MEKTIFLEIYRLIAEFIRSTAEFEIVETQFMYGLVFFAVVALFIAVKANKRMNMIISFSLVALLISYIMRNVENVGYIVTSFSILGLITAFVVHNKERLNYIVYVGFLLFYLFRYFGMNVWISLIVMIVIVFITMFALKTLMTIFVSVLFGALVLGLFLDITYSWPIPISFTALFVVGLILQLAIAGVTAIKDEWVKHKNRKEVA